MIGFIAKSLLNRVVLLVIVSFLSHAVVYLAPGEPSAVDPSNPRMQPEDIERLRAAFHLDDPVHMQYINWIKDLVNGDLRSFKDGQPVLGKIWERFLNSLPLFICVTIIVWTLSFPIGIASALRRGATFDRVTMVLAYTLISVPSFFLAYLLIAWVVGRLGIPVMGIATFGNETASFLSQMADRFWHLFLPTIVSASAGMAILSRYVRSQMVDVMGQDYIRTARAKGLSHDKVVYQHGLRNALLPFVTMLGFLLPGLIGGSVIIEQIFAWPGIGRLGFDAILTRDFPVIVTLNFFAAVLTLVGTFLSDLLYAAVDPRIKPGAATAGG